jgi:hypothetical protein
MVPHQTLNLQQTGALPQMMLYRDLTRTSIICYYPPRINPLRISPINPLRTISTRIYSMCTNSIRINSTRINTILINPILINPLCIDPILFKSTRANGPGRQRVTALNSSARKSLFRPQTSRTGCQRVCWKLGRRPSKVWDMTTRKGILFRRANLERASPERAVWKLSMGVGTRSL